MSRIVCPQSTRDCLLLASVSSHVLIMPGTLLPGISCTTAPAQAAVMGNHARPAQPEGAAGLRAVEARLDAAMAAGDVPEQAREQLQQVMPVSHSGALLLLLSSCNWGGSHCQARVWQPTGEEIYPDGTACC